MSSTPECLDNVIGLSETTCDCFTSGMPYDADTSKSGLYLDQLEGLTLDIAKSIEDCEQGGLWDLMARDRSNATKAFKADMLSSLLSKYKQKRQPFSGIIGSTKWKTNLDLPNTYSGVRIFSANIIGGIMSLKRIGLLFDNAYTFDVSIYNDLEPGPLATYSVTTNPNALTWFNLASVLNLDMNDTSSENPNYYLIYTVSGKKPKDIKAGCGCSSSVYHYYWNINSPQFRSYEKDRWSEYIMLTGINGDDISDRENWGTTSYLNGLVLDVEFKCKVNDLICSDDMDFTSNGVAIAMAYALRYKAGFLLIDSILASGQINRYTMMDRERLMQKKNTYNKEYQDRIEWITDEINWKANDCLACKDFDDILKVGIFS